MRRSVWRRYILHILFGVLAVVVGASMLYSSQEPFKSGDETDCKYVSSLGILKSCEVRSSVPTSSITGLTGYDFSKIVDGSVVYVASSAIPAFVKEFASISKRIVLVTGDADQSVPDDVFSSNEAFIEFIENDKIIHWFSQNCVKTHRKLTQIPIGLDYHTMSKKNHRWGFKTSPVEQEKELLALRKGAPEFHKRKPMCYSNFHFNYKGSKFGNDRADAIESIPKELIFYEPDQVARAKSWKAMTEYAFVPSPAGNGLDCHRTWEALCLGCIPIVKTSALDPLYTDLPVLIVNEWSDVTQTKLENTIREFRGRTFNYDRLLLSYWVNMIKAATKN